MTTVNTVIADLNNFANDVKFVGVDVDRFDWVHIGGVTDVVVDNNVVNIVIEKVGVRGLTDFDTFEGETWTYINKNNEKLMKFIENNGRDNYIDEEWENDEVIYNLMDLNVCVWEQDVINNVYDDNKFLTVKEVINKLNSIDGDFEVVFDYFGEKVENINFNLVNNIESKGFDFYVISGDEERYKLAKKEFECKEFVLC